MAKGKKINGTIQLPGDKSISHRAALFAALHPGESRFRNFNFNNDCTATLNCLADLGITWQYEDQNLRLWGKPARQWRKPPKELNAENSGTTARLLSGILAGLDFETTLTGDASLSRRPMERVLEPLRQMGAEIESNRGFLPLRFRPGTRLQGIRYILPVASAQVKSSLLLAGLYATGETEIIESTPTRDHTERMLRLHQKRNPDGTKSLFSSSAVAIPDLSMTIPGDFSSAAFFIAAALLLPKSELTIENVSLNPTRTGFLQVLKMMGADLRITETSAFPEPAGSISVKHSPLQNVTIPKELHANIIDEIPILAVLSSQAAGPFTLRNVKELRFKESDRISMIVKNLRETGIAVEEFEDGFQLPGAQTFKGGRVQTKGDHRIAMSFAIANLLSENEIVLDNPDCTAVSFPSFWDILNEIT